jgi:hypothetical protein
MLHETLGEHSSSRIGVFKASRVSVEADECSGRPVTNKRTEHVENIRELVHEDCRRTIHDLTETVAASYGILQEILTENMNMRDIAAKFLSPALDK